MTEASITDRIARALYGQFGRRNQGDEEGPEGAPDLEHYHQHARAVLDAIREPDPVALRAAAGRVRISDDDALEVWQTILRDEP